MALKDVLKKQYDYAKAKGWLIHFANAAAKHGFSTADLMGVASRESNIRNIKGDFHDGTYHGFSLMQLDINSHRAWINSGAWETDVESAIFKGAEALNEKREQILKTSKQKSAKVTFRNGKTAQFQPHALNPQSLRHCYLAAYNCGGAAYYHYSVGHNIDAGTTGADYGNDVMTRSDYFERFIETDHVQPPDTISALDQVPGPQVKVDEDHISFADIQGKVSSDSLKSIAVKGIGKAAAPIGAVWSLGAHGKLILILAALVILAVVGFEGYKYRVRLKACITKLIKG